MIIRDRSTRRDFVAILGAAAAGWPFAAHAQQAGVPVVGFLSSRSLEKTKRIVIAFGEALGEAGYLGGRNVAMEYRWAEGQFDRLPALAASLIRREVAVIVTQGSSAVLAARSATATIPIVFVAGFDPVAAGIVSSLNRPGGNITGVSLILTIMAAKRLEFLLEVAPRGTPIAVLINPASPNAAPELKEMQALARAQGAVLQIFNAGTRSEIDAAFASMAQRRIGAVLIGSGELYADLGESLAAHAARLAVPAIYPFREFADAGGLMSLGTSLTLAYRQAGALVGRILKGAKPADLPVQQPATFEFVVNLKTAQSLGIVIPLSLLARADEVIE